MAALLAGSCVANATEVRVGTREELKEALRGAVPGMTILVAPGEYDGGYHVEGVSGTKDAPITIAGGDPSNPPILRGGNTTLHLSRCNYVTVRNLVFRGARDNGIQGNDGGDVARPVRGLRFENLRFEDIGPKGNHDALKLSGVDDFLVSGCTFKGWGGSAIDMVGCHDGTVEDCLFLYKESYRQANYVQIKGGSRNILVQTSFFLGKADRAVNLGGSTGLSYFRPPGVDYEAKDITIAGNRFVGFEAPIAWVTAVGGVVRQNTFYLPQKWVGRISQETDDPRFEPCRDGVFENNLIVADFQVAPFFHVGRNTRPDTFSVRRNAWYVRGKGADIDLGLPEADGIYGVDPRLHSAGRPEMRLTSSDERFWGLGASSYRKAAERGIDDLPSRSGSRRPR